MVKIFGKGLFHKKDKAPTDTSDSTSDAKSTPKIARKRHSSKDKLSSVISESYPPSAVSVLKGVPKSCVKVNGTNYYITFEVDTDDPIIGGINLKRKKDEAIGSLIEQIAGQHIHVYAPADLLDDDKMLIIPDEKTIQNLSGYGIFTDPGLHYTITLVQDDGSISVMDGAIMNYDEIKDYISDDETSPEDLLSDKGILGALEQQEAGNDQTPADNQDDNSSSDDSANYDGINLSDAEIVDDDDEELPSRPDVNTRVGLHDSEELPNNTSPQNTQPTQATNVIAGGNANDQAAINGDNVNNQPVNNAPVQNTQAPINDQSANQPAPTEPVANKQSDDQPIGNEQIINDQPVMQPVNNMPANNEFGVSADPNGMQNGNLMNNPGEQLLNNLPVNQSMPTGQVVNNQPVGNNEQVVDNSQPAIEDDFMAGSTQPQAGLQDFDISTGQTTNVNTTNEMPVNNGPVNEQNQVADSAFAPAEALAQGNPGYDEDQITGDDLDQNMSRMFFSTNFNIDVNSDPIDLELSNDQGITEFDTDRDTNSSWLNQYLNQMGREANQDIRSAHARHLQAVRHLYLNLISKELNDIQDQVSDTTPDTEFGRQKAEIINSADDRRDNLDNEVKVKSDELDQDLKQRAEQAAKRAADEARQAYLDENKPEVDRKKDQIRGRLEEQISRDQVEQIEKLEKRENDEALKLYNQAVDATVQKAMHKYHQFMQQEEKQRVSWSKKIEAFTRHHRKEEVMRAKALAAEVEQQKRVKETRQEMQTKIDELQAKLDRSSKDYQNKLDQMGAESKHLQETNKSSYEARIKSIEADRDEKVKQYQNEIETIKTASEREKQDLRNQISKLENSIFTTKADARNEANAKNADKIAALKEKLSNVTDDANRKIQTRDQIISQLKLDAKEQANHAQEYYSKQYRDSLSVIKQNHQNEVIRLQGKIRAYKLKMKTLQAQFDSQNALIRTLRQNNQDVQNSAYSALQTSLLKPNANGNNSNNNNSLLEQLLAYKQIQELDKQSTQPQVQPTQPTQPTQATQATQIAQKEAIKKPDNRNKTIGWLVATIAIFGLGFGGMEYMQQTQAHQQEQMRQEMQMQIQDAQKRQQARDQEAIKKAKNTAKKTKNKTKKKKANSQSSANNQSSSQSSQSSTSTNDSSSTDDTVYTGY